MPSRLQQIGSTDPNAVANSAYITAVYKQALGRNPTAKEIAQYTGRTAKDVANLVLRDQSPFNPMSQNYTGTLTTEDIFKRTFGSNAGSALYNSLKPPTPTSDADLLSGFNTQFNPYFTELRGQADTAKTEALNRIEQDRQLQQAQMDQNNLLAGQNAIGSYNNQFGDAYGSQMQAQKEAYRMADVDRGQQNFTNGVNRKIYDVNDLNRQRLNEIQGQEDQAKGTYFSQNRFANIV